MRHTFNLYEHILVGPEGLDRLHALIPFPLLRPHVVVSLERIRDRLQGGDGLSAVAGLVVLGAALARHDLPAAIAVLRLVEAIHALHDGLHTSSTVTTPSTPSVPPRLPNFPHFPG